MANQNHAAKRASGTGEPKWKRSRWSSVTTSVVVVKTRMARNGIRTAAQVPRRTASSSSAHPPAYAAPRNAAVVGGLMVQANTRSVCSAPTNSATNARSVRPLKTASTSRVPGKIIFGSPGSRHLA